MALKKKATAKAKPRLAKAAEPKAKKTKTVAKAKVKAVKLVAAGKPISQKQTKAQIYAELAQSANISKGEVKSLFSALRSLIERHVKPKGSGEITLPELGIKVRRVSKKAAKARTGRNPFTGEEIQIPAKPARKSVKVSALKTLKALATD